MASIYTKTDERKTFTSVGSGPVPDLVEVIFRRYREKPYSILAIFPYEIASKSGDVMCYEHVGQHGHGDYKTMMHMTRAARPEEYDKLWSELTSLGYKVMITKTRYKAKMQG